MRYLTLKATQDPIKHIQRGRHWQGDYSPIIDRKEEAEESLKAELGRYSFEKSMKEEL
jgi:hypothetical protein